MEQRIRRALVSAYDKQGIVSLCRALVAADVKILSSGGTARLLEGEGLPVTRVSDYTGFPEMLDGRVKTLHPKIHAGILALRSKPKHLDDLERNGIEPIDLVVVNLYPFERTAASPQASPEEVVEMIDIGGPALVRAAAKNHVHVGVVVDPADYPAVVDEIRGGHLSAETRLRLAAKAFRHTAGYDGAIRDHLARQVESGEAQPDRFPERFRPEFIKVQRLRYGENPHQEAAFYRDAGEAAPSIAHAAQLQGKELSFNNILDFDAAVGVAADFDEIACAIIKHGNPCGVARGSTPAEAFRRALECDPVSAFGGVVALNRDVDTEAAEAIAEVFLEGVAAPGFGPAARERLSRKKNLRLLAIGTLSGYHRSGLDLRRVHGGLLVQGWDSLEKVDREAEVATARRPTDEEWAALAFAWKVVRHVKSNAIVYGTSDRTVGIGAGQMSRVDSARIGIQKAGVPLRGAVMASDAFFPFRDGIDVAAEAGVTAVIQPGGSKRDAEVIAAADEHDMAMVLTGRRHFRH